LDGPLRGLLGSLPRLKADAERQEVRIEAPHDHRAEVAPRAPARSRPERLRVAACT